CTGLSGVAMEDPEPKDPQPARRSRPISIVQRSAGKQQKEIRMKRLSALAVFGSQQGAALVLTLLILTLLSALAVGLSALGMTEGAASGSWRDYSSAFFAADAGLESGVVNLRTILQGNQTATADELNGIAAPSLTTTGLSFS